MVTHLATAEATANIAVVKYWGKRDEKFILPTESSLSFTMDDQLKTRTTVMFSPLFKQDELWLNGQSINLKESEAAERLQQLDLIRKQAGLTHRARIVSMNCFPTAAGFASSAAGMAALAVAASKAAGLNLSPRELSILARMGSGSACRSVLGGCVEWKRGQKADGTDSFAEQIAPASHWPELRNVIAIVDAGKKKVPSRAGMRQTVLTSSLYKARLAYVPALLEKMKQAILARDFPTFGELTMRESSSMHAVMLDTWPPILYLNEWSKQVMYAVGEYNEHNGEVQAAYTFDAGPNAHIFTTADRVDALTKRIKEIEGVVKIMTCTVGEGPRVISKPNEHLLNPHTGQVRVHSYDEKSRRIQVEA